MSESEQDAAALAEQDAVPLRRLETLQERLNYLLANLDAPAEHKKSRYVAEWIRNYASNDPTGQTEGLTHAYLGFLLRGEQDNPSIKKIRGLAKFFGVSPAYLLGETEPDVQDEPAITVLTAKARGLKPQGLRLATGLVEALLREDDDAPGS